MFNIVTYKTKDVKMTYIRLYFSKILKGDMYRNPCLGIMLIMYDVVLIASAKCPMSWNVFVTNHALINLLTMGFFTSSNTSNCTSSRE